jgi:hypothetical protein
MNKKGLFRFIIATIVFTGLLFWFTNPSLTDFKEFNPQVDSFDIYRHKKCNKYLKLQYRKEKNYLFYSYFEFSFHCSKDIEKHDSKFGINGKRYSYIGIFKNFYLVAKP